MLVKKISTRSWIKKIPKGKEDKKAKFTIKKVATDKGKFEIDGLWERKKTEIIVGAVRDWKFVKWRIIDSPFKSELFTINIDNETIGYFALEDDRGTAIIADLIILNKYLETSIFKEIELLLSGLGYKKIRTVVTDAGLRSVLFEHGYENDLEFQFIYNDFVNKIDPKDFYLTLVDSDWSLVETTS